MDDPNIIELFAGHGMLGEGVRLARPGSRVLGYVEREAYAAACLMARMDDKALEPAPVFVGDIHDVDGREFSAVPALWIVGGFPCQDISVAGKGEGIRVGNRSGLWFEYARIIRESGAVGVFAENVSALVGRGLDIVLKDLAEMGFDAEWCCLTASAVGAPHRRERIFIMAHRAQRGLGERGQSPAGDRQPDRRDQELADHPGQRSAGRRLSARSRHEGPGEADAEWCCERMAHAAHADGGGRVGGTQAGAGSRERGRRRLAGGRADVEYAEPSERRTENTQRGKVKRIAAGRPGASGDELGDAAGERPDGWRIARGSADERLPFPPGPAQRDQWADIIARWPHLAPAIEPGVRVLVDGMAVVVDESRADQLRGCGNGVVALQAAVAFEVLAGRLGI